MRVIFHMRIPFDVFTFLRYALVNAVVPDSKAGMFFDERYSDAARKMAARKKSVFL